MTLIQATEAAEGIRVLHVDDDPAVGDLVAAFLERENDRFEIQTMTDVAAAEAALADRNIDCIVSDYDMPERNGIQFLEAVRQEHPDLPFILYTGKGSEEVASEAISAGVTDYLQKGSGQDQYAVLANRITNAVEHRRSQQALSEQNRELRSYERMVNSMRETACIYDKDERFQIVNEALAEWYGMSRDELIGQKSLLIPHIRSETEDGTDPFQELLDGERDEFRGETAPEFPHQSHTIMDYRLTPLEVDGSIEGVVGVARHITDRKEREQQLKEQNKRLEEFASVVSHDLRNPLTVAQGRLALLREECDSDYIDDIEQAHQRMEALIEDLLELARDGISPSETTSVDLADFVQSCWQNVDTKAATLVTDIDLAVVADESRLRQLLENLIRNAVEHGGDEVTVTVGEHDGGFYVEDDGPGIPEDDRDTVFDAGYSTSVEGTGFGLRIVDQVAEAHGWQVRVTEGRDGGARFEITGVAAVPGDRSPADSENA